MRKQHHHLSNRIAMSLDLFSLKNKINLAKFNWPLYFRCQIFQSNKERSSSSSIDFKKCEGKHEIVKDRLCFISMRRILLHLVSQTPV